MCPSFEKSTQCKAYKVKTNVTQKGIDVEHGENKQETVFK